MSEPVYSPTLPAEAVSSSDGYLVWCNLARWLWLQQGCADFEKSQWFQSLLQYGDTTDSGDDLDVKLIPSIVEKVLLAKLTGKMCHLQLQLDS